MECQSPSFDDNLMLDKFLLEFERRMRLAGKEKVLLLLDNFFGHKVVKTGEQIQITGLELLPPNCTNHYQSMDVGIIKTFKTYYRKDLTLLKIDNLMSNAIFK
jgi:hypothetical protein